MIPCKHCNTLNSLDSTFCKRCGTGLPEDQLDHAKAELELILDEGFKALDQNRVEEASAIAESATTADPSSVRALSLRSSCHERRGEIAEALECAERIVELNPNSELDKIKRNQLRSALAASVTYKPQSGRSIAVLAGVSAFVLILCIGAIFARRPDATKPGDRVAMNSPSTNAADPIGQGVLDEPAKDSGNRTAQGGANNAPQTEPQLQSQPQSQSSQPSDTQRAASEAPTTPDGAFPPAPNRSRGLPPADSNSNPYDVFPVEPTGPVGSGNQSGPNKTTPKNDGGDPQPTAEAPVAGQAQPAPAPVDPGQIHITVHSGSPERIGSSGSQPASSSSAGSSQVYSRIGQERLQTGNYSGAATAFDQALKNGGDPVVLNHWLGLAYEHLGRTSDAISAYHSAIQSCDSALSAGKGNQTVIQATKEACQTAVNRLHGG